MKRRIGKARTRWWRPRRGAVVEMMKPGSLAASRAPTDLEEVGRGVPALWPIDPEWARSANRGLVSALADRSL